MKNIKSIIKKAFCVAAIGSMAFATVSCDDMLDTKPQGTFTDEQIGDEEAIDLMTAAYGSLLCHFFGNNESFAGPITNWIFDVRSDDALKGGDGVTMEGYIHQLEVGNVQSDNDVANFKWRNNYYSVSRCNTAIRGIQASSNLSDLDKAAYIAEMKTLRAYFYFDMLRIFKQFPYFDETVVNPSECRADQYTRDEIAGFIKQDLRASYTALPESQAQVGRFNKYVAAALLARVALFTSDWAEAEEYAGYVISSGKYELYPNFLDMSKPEFNNQYESVMAIQFSSANSPDQYNFSNCLNCTWSEGYLYGNGDDFYLASQNLVNAFRTDADGHPFIDTFNQDDYDMAADYADPRLFLTVGMPGTPYMFNGNYIMDRSAIWSRSNGLYGYYVTLKHNVDPDGEYLIKSGLWWGSPMNRIVLRYADIMLMRAEALVQLNQGIPEAIQIVNDLRARAAQSTASIADYTRLYGVRMACRPYTGSYSPDEALKIVKHERRVELAMESDRFFDLVRWGEAAQVINRYYAEEADNCAIYSSASFTADKNEYLPIPYAQVAASNGHYKQNIGNW